MKLVSHLLSWGKFLYKLSLLRNIEFSDHTNHLHINKGILKPLQPSPQTTLYIMHYQTLIVALFASAAMAKGPWVSSFINDDCEGPGAGDAVSMSEEGCAVFHPKYNNIAVNFGGAVQADSISVYTDSNCQNPAGDDIYADQEDDYPQQCISMSYWGAKWGSVQITPPEYPGK